MERNEKEQQLPKRCPRCESTNTKFCYFNNYSQSQPRHFCKACRRYWTEGGSLRNVPQGGGSSRRGKRQKKTPAPAPRMPAALVTPRPAGEDIPILSAGSEGALPLGPPAPSYYVAGGIGEGLVGLQGRNEMRFHPGVGGIMGETRNQSPMMPLVFPPGYINFPVSQQQMQSLLPPPSMMADPTSLPISRQQLQVNTAVNVFTAAGTAGPSVSAAGAYDGGEGFWNVFGSGVGGVPPPK